MVVSGEVRNNSATSPACPGPGMHFFSVAQSAALAPRKEMPALIPDASSRSAEVYHLIWKREKPVVQESPVYSAADPGRGSTHPGPRTFRGHERKIAAHADICHSVGVCFIPKVIESLGGWVVVASDVIRVIG